MRYTGLGAPALAVAIGMTIGTAIGTGATPAGAGELLPDLRPVVPRHLRIVADGERELLHFSHGLANTGHGPWRVRPGAPLGEGQEGRTAVDAVQEIVDDAGRVVNVRPVGRFERHAGHAHWHVGGVARFEVRVGSPEGPVFGAGAVETASCLVDWGRLDGARAHRTFQGCAGGFQGLSAGWADQAYQSGEGPQLDLTGAPAGRYYLVSTSNPDGAFVEEDPANNTAWVAFELARDDRHDLGAAMLSVVGHSPCDGGLCGDGRREIASRSMP